MQPDGFDPEVIAAMTEALAAACNARPNVPRDVIAQRILVAVRLGERSPVRLREAALDKED
jgi:hypothetical protein